jgi:hypothetical protein
MEGNLLKGRTAFSVRQKPTDDPVFGALWYTANMETNRDTRMAVLQSIKIDNIKINRGNSNNIYRDRGGVSTNDQRRPSQGARPSQQPANTQNRNNVVADRQGNVHQKDANNNWSQRSGNQWQPSTSASTSDLDRQMQSRDRGQTRNASYNQMNRGGNMGGGGARAGGGGRRR